jgi:dihydrofolate synthase/folylpolyglutamate synthase
VIAPQEESVERVLRGRAGSLGAEVWGAGKEIEFGDVQPRPDGYGCRFRVKTPFAEHPGLEIRLIGEHQVENAAVAVGIIDVLRSRGKLKVTEKAIAEGLAGVEMPGRIEVMGASPWVVIDGAHNPMAIEVLVKAVRANFKYRRLVLLFAMATDKDIPGSLDIVLPIVDEVFFTLTNSPRAAKPQMLKHLAQARGKEKAHSEPDESKALEQALAVTGPEDLLLVTGSLYLAGDLRPVIQKALAGREGPMSVRGGVF